MLCRRLHALASAFFCFCPPLLQRFPVSAPLCSNAFLFLRSFVSALSVPPFPCFCVPVLPCLMFLCFPASCPSFPHSPTPALLCFTVLLFLHSPARCSSLPARPGFHAFPVSALIVRHCPVSPASCPLRLSALPDSTGRKCPSLSLRGRNAAVAILKSKEWNPGTKHGESEVRPLAA